MSTKAAGEHRYCYVTVSLSDNEAIGALVLAKSIRQSGTLQQLVCLVSDVGSSLIEALRSVFDHVNVISLDSEAEKLIQHRPDLKQALLRIQCWRLHGFDKCVFLDPASFMLQNTDELFDREEFSASPDTKWPDHFNAGVFVFHPNENTYHELLAQAQSSLVVDVSFQGILNNFFNRWATEDIAKHLPFIYNVTPNVFYTYQPAVRSFKDSVRIVQFCQEPRPWNTLYDIEGNCVDDVSADQQYFYTSWWKAFNTHVKPLLDATCHQCVKVSERIQLYADPQTPPPQSSGSVDRDPDKHAWETGCIDYMGRDSFENIKKKLDESINE